MKHAKELVSLATAAALMCASAPASASSGGVGFGSGSWEGVYPLLGFSGALTYQAEGLSGLLGAELSVPYLGKDLWWAGGWTDVARDISRETTVVGMGAEAGFLFGGVDAGYVTEIGPVTRHGVRVRALATAVVGATFLGYTYWASDVGPSHVISLGILLKLPVLKL